MDWINYSISPNLERLILGCIDADFCNQIVFFQHFSRSTKFTYFCTAQNSKIQQKSRHNFGQIELNWIILTDFRMFGNFLICFRKFDWKSDTRHSSLEFVAKSGQNFIKNFKFRRKHAKFDGENEKNINSIFNREKLLAIFGWNFEFE